MLPDSHVHRDIEFAADQVFPLLIDALVARYRSQPRPGQIVLHLQRVLVDGAVVAIQRGVGKKQLSGRVGVGAQQHAALVLARIVPRCPCQRLPHPSMKTPTGNRRYPKRICMRHQRISPASDCKQKNSCPFLRPEQENPLRAEFFCGAVFFSFCFQKTKRPMKVSSLPSAQTFLFALERAFYGMRFLFTYAIPSTINPKNTIAYRSIAGTDEIVADGGVFAKTGRRITRLLE